MTGRTILMPFAVLLGLGAAPALANEPAMRGALDGMTFVSTIDVAQYDTPFPDRMVFEDGTFFSEECQRRCNFGTGAYFTRIEGDSIAFVADLVCDEAPQSVRWEGRITGDRIEGTALWKVERFYWTVERQATFSGTRVPEAQEQAATTAE